MSNLLELANAAAKHGDWLQVGQTLQQRLMTKDLEPLSENESDQWLSLALNVLEAGDFATRWDLAKIFPSLGGAAVHLLIELLQDTEAELESRWFAARILGEFDSPATVQALIAILQKADDEDLSLMAAEALSNLGSLAIASLTSLLQQDDSRLLTVKSLAKIRHPEVVAPLLGVINDPQPDVRAIAIEALANFHDPQIDAVLLEALTDPASSVRSAAIGAVGVRSQLASESDLVARLADRLFDLNLKVCQQAAIALGRIGSKAAVAALFHVLQSPHTPAALKVEVIRALGWAESSAALEYLRQAIDLLRQPATDPAIYQEIAAVLGRWSDPTLKPALAEILVDWLNSDHPAINHSQVKQTIALSLGHLGQLQSVEPLTQLLADEDMGVRLHAIAALKSLDFQASLDHLESLAQRENLSDEMKRGVAIALQEWGK